MIIIIRVLLMCVAIWLLHAIPQTLDNAVNALPQPLPQIIGVAMFIGVTLAFIGLLNKLMKGSN